jgi:hypothetical protein
MQASGRNPMSKQYAEKTAAYSLLELSGSKETTPSGPGLKYRGLRKTSPLYTQKEQKFKNLFEYDTLSEVLKGQSPFQCF